MPGDAHVRMPLTAGSRTVRPDGYDGSDGESGKPYRLASRNDCAGAESTRYSRFGPSQR